MRYNVLYGILVRGVPPAPSSMYYKKYTAVSLTERGRRLLDAVAPADAGRRAVFACAVCSFALDTVFGEQIRALDENNTYNRPGRADSDRSDVTTESARACLMRGLAGSADDVAWLVPMLDSDIAERLVVPQWIELMAAACLQLLREAY